MNRAPTYTFNVFKAANGFFIEFEAPRGTNQIHIVHEGMTPGQIIDSILVAETMNPTPEKKVVPPMPPLPMPPQRMPAKTVSSVEDLVRELDRINT